MKIKASSITNLSDARYFSAKNDVAWLGFNLEAGTPGYLDPIFMKAIREWVEGPKIVGEFAGTPLAEVREAAAFLGLDAVQVRSTRYELADLETLAGLEVLLEIPVSRAFSKTIFKKKFRQAAPFVQHFVLDFACSDIPWYELKLDLDFWQEVCTEQNILFHFDLKPENLPDFRARFPQAGLCLVGGEEERVGVKSFDDLEAIFDILEN